VAASQHDNASICAAWFELDRQHRTGSTLFGNALSAAQKTTLIDRRTGNLGAVQPLLGHTKIESNVRYLGIEVDDALAMRKQDDV
jgi:hypothetical protein